MAESAALLETITAAMLDGLVLAFWPVDPDGTGLPTGLLVDARHGDGGRGATAEVSFEELLLSGAADKVLSVAITEAVTPVVEAVTAEAASGRH